MEANFTILSRQRELISRVINETPEAELFAIPPGRSNNIAWNLAHVVTVQQLLSYALCGLTPNVPAEYAGLYSRETSPADWDTPPDIAVLLKQLEELPGQTAADYAAGKFENFHPFTTSLGTELNSIEESIAFNNFHEGVHTGIMMSIRRELAQT